MDKGRFVIFFLSLCYDVLHTDHVNDSFFRVSVEVIEDLVVVQGDPHP